MDRDHFAPPCGLGARSTKNTWPTRGLFQFSKSGIGGAPETWLVDYRDGDGKRRFKTFDKKKEADKYDARSRVEVIDGNHVADSASVTVKEAGELWLKSAQANNLEWTTIEQYRQTCTLCRSSEQPNCRS